MDWKQIIEDLRPPLTLQEVADAVGMSRGAVHDLRSGRTKSVLYETGLSLVALHKRVMREKRANRLAAEYAAGRTLAEIGSANGISRTRVRRIVQTSTVAAVAIRKEAAQAKRRAVLATRVARREAKAAKLGVCVFRLKEIADQGWLGAYRKQKDSARRRGIDFELTFGKWLELWEASGHLNDRGRGHGKFCMSRIGDVGSYSDGNVFIQPADENNRQARFVALAKKDAG